MYGQAIGTGPVAEYIGQTGLDVLKGADMLADVADQYESSVEYADNQIAKNLRDVARIHFADLGTRIFYTAHGGYDTHANEMPTHPKLMNDVSGAVSDFLDDLEEHDAADNVTVFLFTEFGRRMRDNGSGTDHGTGGGAYMFGKDIRGGLYGEYPSLDPVDWAHREDLQHTIDFRGIYSTILEQWLDVEAKPIVKGEYEQISPVRQLEHPDSGGEDHEQTAWIAESRISVPQNAGNEACHGLPGGHRVSRQRGRVHPAAVRRRRADQDMAAGRYGRADGRPQGVRQFRH